MSAALTYCDPVAATSFAIMWDNHRPGHQEHTSNVITTHYFILNWNTCGTHLIWFHIGSYYIPESLISVSFATVFWISGWKAMCPEAPHQSCVFGLCFMTISLKWVHMACGSILDNSTSKRPNLRISFVYVYNLRSKSNLFRNSCLKSTRPENSVHEHQLEIGPCGIWNRSMWNMVAYWLVLYPPKNNFRVLCICVLNIWLKNNVTLNS